MITCTQRVDLRPLAFLRSPPRARPPARRGRRGFTLSEVLIASTLSVVVLAGVLGAFIFLGRTGLAAGQYQAMENELRHGIDLFADDARRATDIRWTNSWRITFTVPGAANATEEVTYLFEPLDEDSLAGRLYRVDGTGARRTLVQDVSRDFSFRRYKLEQPGQSDNTAQSDLDTKQVQITLRTLRATPGGPALTQAAISARYVLRSKRVN